tara:strand:+ start:10 stop:537 length:528 start_codon:yes stop_codon:yes gene_type:complete
MARVGLARLEYLMERMDRNIDLEGSDIIVNTLTSDLGVTVTAGGLGVTAGGISVTAGGVDFLEGTVKLSNGGAVTQLTSKSTTVVLAKPTGKITLHNAALADAAIVSFTVTCTGFARATDVCIVNHHSGGTVGAYVVQATGHATNSFKITVTNVSGGSLSEAAVLHYALIQTEHT